jgi:phage tail protein X
MQFVQLQGDSSVAALVQRVYGLAPGAAGAAVAQKALLAANPHLSNISQLPAGTPVVLPQVTGITPTAAVQADPRRTTLLTTLSGLAAAVPLPAASGSKPDPTQQAAVTALQTDVAAFAKQFGT